MLKNSWLTRLYRRVVVPKSRSLKRRSFTPPAAIIELLETRSMLSAATVAVGSEIRVNTQTIGDQSAPVVAMDSSGDYVAVWQSANQDGSGWGIYAQRFSATGVAQGAEFRVNSFMTGDQTAPSVAMDANGDFVIAWVSAGQDGSGAGVYAQRYSASGLVQGGEFRANTYTNSDQSTPAVAMDANGDFVIVWDSLGQFQNQYTAIIGAHSIYAQRYSANGTAQGTEFRVVSSTMSSTTVPSVAMDATGNFVVTWISADFDNFGDPFPHVAAKRFNASGAVIQDEFIVSNGAPHGQQNPEVAMNAAGNFVITWWGVGDDTNADEGVLGKLYDANGNAIAGYSFPVNTTVTGQQTNPRVAIASNGTFVITWQSRSPQRLPRTPALDGSGYGVFAQQFDASGNPVGSETKVNTTSGGDQFAPAVAMDSAGDFVVVWQSTGQDDSGAGVYSQQFLTTQAPLLLQIEGTTLSAIGPLFTPLTSQLNVRDAQSNNWTGATISITANYQSSQDVLSFVNTAKITGAWNAATGRLTLTGTDSVVNYRAALQSVTYHNTSITPNIALTRTISFQAKAGATLTNTVTRNMTVRATSTPPTLTGMPATVNFVNPTGPLFLAPNLAVTEPDALPIQSATVSFTGWQGEDRLAFDNSLALQHTFTQDLTAHTATLTIFGSASAAGYQTLLRSMTYQDVAGLPNTSAIRAATFTVNDQLHSGSATGNVRVFNYLSGLSSVINFNRGSSALAIAPSLVVTTPTGVNVQSATVTFANWQGEDRLAFYNSLALQHTFTQDLTAHTATLTITGIASGAGYQTLLRSVTYQDVAGKPVTFTRDVTFTVKDGTNTVSATEHITVTDRPAVVLINDSSSLVYHINGPAIAIMNQATVTDPDSDNLSSMTIQIASGYQVGHDILTFASAFGITGTFNATTGTLTLSGTSYVGNYREALRTVMFNTNGTGVSTATRTFKVIAIDDMNVTSAPVTRNVTVMS